jgi:glycosyltransferase involved in cell wall biosynthesis
MVVGNSSLKGIYSIWYVYPFWHYVSFGTIAEKHVEQLKKYLYIETIDELAFPYIQVSSNPLILMHPYFYPLQKHEKKIKSIMDRIRGIIGIDVADSNHITDYAVRLTEYAKALIVPSNFSRNAYINSGVKKDIWVVPHGVNEYWIDKKKQKAVFFDSLEKLKKRRNLKLILAYILHSPYRKGLDLLLQIYQKLINEYNNVLLVTKTARGVGYFLESLEYKGGELETSMDGKVYMGWLSEQQQMELMDLCDLFLLTSRGGGFEHPALLALARGMPVVGAKGGAWEEFLPKWALVKSRESDYVLANNPIHNGKGVEMDIDEAVDKIVDILNNYDKYKEKVREHIDKVIREKFTWEKIGLKLKDIILKYV